MRIPAPPLPPLPNRPAAPPLPPFQPFPPFPINPLLPPLQAEVPVQVWAVNEKPLPTRMPASGWSAVPSPKKTSHSDRLASAKAVGTAFGAVPAVAAAGRAGTISWSRRATLAAANANGAAHGESAPAPELRAVRSGDSVSAGTADMAAADGGTAVDLVADDGNAGASNSGWVASALSPGAVSCAVVPAAAKLSAARLVVAAPAGPVLRPVSGAAATAWPGGVDRSAAAGRRSAARPRVLG